MMSAFWAENDYIGFFSKYSEPMIIDEVQRVPELLSAIQVKVDENRRMNGRFIITGSHQPRLREAVAQSLAGRTTIHTLLPLSYEEIKKTGRTDNLIGRKSRTGCEFEWVIRRSGGLFNYTGAMAVCIRGFFYSIQITTTLFQYQ